MTGVAHPVPWFQRPHQRRQTFLASLATLAGCGRSLGGTLPDGTRPDVLSQNSRGTLLFIGDAKDTERPHCGDTQARLDNYFSWAGAHVRNGGDALIAICFGLPGDADGWMGLLRKLARGHGMPVASAELHRFGSDLLLAQILVRLPR